jgi:hypothetical protein
LTDLISLPNKSNNEVANRKNEPCNPIPMRRVKRMTTPITHLFMPIFDDVETILLAGSSDPINEKCPENSEHSYVVPRRGLASLFPILLRAFNPRTHSASGAELFAFVRFSERVRSATKHKKPRSFDRGPRTA